MSWPLWYSSVLFGFVKLPLFLSVWITQISHEFMNSHPGSQLICCYSHVTTNVFRVSQNASKPPDRIIQWSWTANRGAVKGTSIRTFLNLHFRGETDQCIFCGSNHLIIIMIRESEVLHYLGMGNFWHSWDNDRIILLCSNVKIILIYTCSKNEIHLPRYASLRIVSRVLQRTPNVTSLH